MKKKLFAVCIIILLYAVAKAYVLHTPSPHDDKIPDVVKDALLDVVDNDF